MAIQKVSMMKKTDDEKVQRRAVMAGMGAVVAGLAVTAASPEARAQTGATSFQPARHADDAWFDQIPGNHRVFIDTSTVTGGQDALRYGMNILNAHENAYAGADKDYAMIVCYRHGSTAFGYGDAIWEKYGELLNGRMQLTDPETKEVPTRNILNIASGPFARASIPSMIERGVHFAICATATRGIAGMIAGSTGQETDAVAAEIMAGAIPNARFVPAGVMGMTRAQEYGYSLLYAG